MAALDTQVLPVKFTPGAMEEIRRLAVKEVAGTNKALRIGVTGGGCAGFSYILEFDEPKSSDNIYELEEVRVLIDKAQELYLYGTTLEFTKGLSNRGFEFKNPNATATCGCGTSFSA
jgi:iron-sulfur cluster assembly protein